MLPVDNWMKILLPENSKQICCPFLKLWVWISEAPVFFSKHCSVLLTWWLSLVDFYLFPTKDCKRFACFVFIFQLLLSNSR